MYIYRIEHNGFSDSPAMLIGKHRNEAIRKFTGHYVGDILDIECVGPLESVENYEAMLEELA